MINQVIPKEDGASAISSTKKLATLVKPADASLCKFPLIVPKVLLTLDTSESIGLGILGTQKKICSLQKKLFHSKS